MREWEIKHIKFQSPTTSIKVFGGSLTWNMSSCILRGKIEVVQSCVTHYEKGDTMFGRPFWTWESTYTTFECATSTYQQSHLVRLPISTGERSKNKSLYSNSRLHYELLYHLTLIILQTELYLNYLWPLGRLYRVSDKHQ